MNQGQKLFYNFFIERVQDDKKEVAKVLLEDSFKRQAEGTFNLTYFQEIMPKLISIIKPEAVEEVKEAMENFATKL